MKTLSGTALALSAMLIATSAHARYPVRRPPAVRLTDVFQGNRRGTAGNAVSLAIRRESGRLGACFRSESARYAAPTAFEILFRLNPNGHVIEAHAVGPIPRAAVRCLETAATTILFPRATAARITAQFRYE